MPRGNVLTQRTLNSHCSVNQTLDRLLLWLPVAVIGGLMFFVRLDVPLYDFWSAFNYYTGFDSTFSDRTHSYIEPFADVIMLGSRLAIDFFAQVLESDLLLFSPCWVYSLFLAHC